MPQYKGNFRLTVLSPKRLVFESEVNSVFIPGDQSEYELLAYHYPIVGVIAPGDVVIDGQKSITVRSGVVRFFANECTILVEESKKPPVKAGKH